MLGFFGNKCSKCQDISALHLGKYDYILIYLHLVDSNIANVIAFPRM